MIENVPISKMFMGSGDPRTEGELKGYRYPDGHVLIFGGSAEFLRLLKIHQQQEGPQYDEFRGMYPDECIPVHMTEDSKDYVGHRIPRSVSVPTEIIWIDYDSHVHSIRIHRIRRKAFETLAELKMRLVPDSELLRTISESVTPNTILQSVDSGKVLAIPLNLPRELEA